MTTDRGPRPALAALPLAALLLLAGCDEYVGRIKPASEFGEPNRQTMMAQVIDPDPEYDTLVPPTSANHAGQAVERYRTDKVKKPDRVTSTQTTGGGGN